MPIGGGRVEHVLINGEVSYNRGAPIMERRGQSPSILPEQITCPAVQRLNRVGALDEDNSIVNERRDLVPTHWQVPSPRFAQIVHIGAVDLAKRAIAQTVVSAPPSEPISIRWMLEHIVCDWRDVVEQGCPLRCSRVEYSIVICRKNISRLWCWCSLRVR